jgi:hypothetical protein
MIRQMLRNWLQVPSRPQLERVSEQLAEAILKEVQDDFDKLEQAMQSELLKKQDKADG